MDGEHGCLRVSADPDRPRPPRWPWAVVGAVVTLALFALGLSGLPSPVSAAGVALPSATDATPEPPTPSTSPSTSPSPSASAPSVSSPVQDAPRAAAKAPATPTPPLRLVGLGDSVMAGTACDCDGIAQGIADGLAERDDRAVDYDNLGQSGDTTTDLLDELGSDDVRAAVRKADVVVLVIGANDLGALQDQDEPESCDDDCYRPLVTAMADRLAEVLQVVDQLTSGRATVLVDGYWNVFEDGEQATSVQGAGQVVWSRSVTREANTAIAATAAAAGATYVDLAAAFTAAAGSDPTGLLADDGDHPNAAGVAVIVRANLTALP